ncbi:MAG: hypothetical protein LRZ84_12155 [Desertifilum sp.]|nr:hypothetical protein [Desertifilum sp.]
MNQYQRVLSDWILEEHRKHLFPYFVFFVLSGLFFGISSFVPYEFTPDISYQLKSVIQFLHGETRIVNYFAYPNPNDISQNSYAWIAWWSPGITLLFLPFMAIGIPIAAMLRLIAYMSFGVGCIGWLNLARFLKINIKTQTIFAIILALYAITTGGAIHFYVDVLPFGIMPWFILIVLKNFTLKRKPWNLHSSQITRMILMGLTLGSIYWIKYSAFLIALGFVLYVFVYFCLQASKSTSRRDGLILFSFFGLGVLVPAALLSIIHKFLGGVASAVSQMEAASFNSSNTRGIGLFYSLLGSPGLALFNNIEYLLGGSLYKFFNIDDANAVELNKALIGIVGTIIIALYFIYFKKKVF